MPSTGSLSLSTTGYVSSTGSPASAPSFAPYALAYSTLASAFFAFDAAAYALATGSVTAGGADGETYSIVVLT